MTPSTEQLAEFRSELDSIDEQLVALLGRRYDICRSVARYKKQNQIAMMQPGRVAEVTERCSKLALAQDVNPDFVRSLYDLIIQEACRLEDEIIGTAAT